MSRREIVWFVLAVGACGTTGAPDKGDAGGAGPVADAGHGPDSAPAVVDASAPDRASTPPPIDAARADAATTGSPDAAPTSSTGDIEILIDNFCNTSVRPTDVSAALNSGLMLIFHNESVDYQADVWSSRGYGELELDTGGTWNDPVTHCGGPTAYVESFEISIAGGPIPACPSATLTIHCQ